MKSASKLFSGLQLTTKTRDHDIEHQGQYIYFFCLKWRAAQFPSRVNAY